jgi:hypothetical protein
LAAVATYRVIAALAALTPKPRQTTTANTAMINLRLVISNGERFGGPAGVKALAVGQRVEFTVGFSDGLVAGA